MDQEPWLSCEKTAVLQGGFLLANKQCHPSSLAAVRKEEWGSIGHPIVQAATEICGAGRGGQQDKKVNWRKKILCLIWSKLLEMERGEDIDARWRDNPLFAIANGLPDMNYTVLYELVKAMRLSTSYVELLLCFQPAELSAQVGHLVQHVKKDTTEADVQLLVEVWWELLRGRRPHMDVLDQLFSDQCADLAKGSADPSPQMSKRFKPDPESHASAACVMSCLFQGLTDIKDHVTVPETCHFGLANCLDSIYTVYLLNQTTELPIEKRLRSITRLLSQRERHGAPEGVELTEAICESQRDLSAVLTPSLHKPCSMTLTQAMQIVLGLMSSWRDRGLLKMPDIKEPSNSAVRLKSSLSLVLESLQNIPDAEKEQVVKDFKSTLEGLSAMTHPDPESTKEELARVAVAIIDNHLEGFPDLSQLFACGLDWASSKAEWISCLERNKASFQQKDIVMKLVSTLIAECQSGTDVKLCQKVKDVIVDVFTQLPLSEKNEALAELLAVSEQGLQGCLPQMVTAGFEEELNLAFNCLIQGDAQSSLDAAVSAVARVAFQNPEATLRRCCHLAVVNLGAHSLLAKILQQLRGLRFPGADAKQASLLGRCLQNTVWGKLASAQEEEQFQAFVVALMDPSVCFLSPVEAFRRFVRPNLSSSPRSGCSLELSLRLLRAALLQEESGESAHWVMSCSPFPLLYCLCHILNNSIRCWEGSSEQNLYHLSMECKEMLTGVLSTLAKVVGREVTQTLSTWSRALSWLYSKVEELDWTVRFHLKEVWGTHFKYEVPASLFSVSSLSEHEWSGLELPQYGQGTGLLAWLECCSISDHVQEKMLECLSLDLQNPSDLNMFSKGVLVAVSQTLPWCAAAEWERLLRALKELLRSGRLHVPYSLEYVDFLPLLDMRAFDGEMRLSVLLLRVFQLLCSPSCADWLPPEGWAHAGRLYAGAIRDLIVSLKSKAPVPSSSSAEHPRAECGAGTLGEEVLFVLVQLFCHVTHVQVMLPEVSAEPLFLCALEILALYQAVLTAFPRSCTALQAEDTRHFLTTITDNLQSAEMRAILDQKISQL